MTGAKQPFIFGETPLIVVAVDEGTYQVRNDQTADTEEMGIPDVFAVDRLDVMRARALAFGYMLTVEEVG